jgi:flagellar biogenesis protein FliO
MSRFFPGISFSVLVIATLILGVSLATAADPKIVRTSHQSADKSAVPQADDSDEDEISYSPQWPEPPNMGAMLLRLCIGTVVVLGLCVGVLWFGKPWLQKLQTPGTGHATLQIEGSIAVGNRAMLYLVRAGGTQLIAGTDATGLKSLIALPVSFKEVLDEQVADEEPAAVSATVAPSSPITTPIAFGVRSALRPNAKD